MKSIWVITVCYNSEKETEKCIKSILSADKSGFNVSVLVIDNGCEISFTSSEENVHVVRSEKNLGFSGGNNLGISYALSHGADFVLLINNDTIADSKLLVSLFRVYKLEDKIGIACPKIYFEKGHEFHKEKYSEKEKGHVLWYAGGGIDWKNGVSYHRGVDEVDSGQYDKQSEITFATGCCMLIPRVVLEKVGIFDDKYFLYFEDADLSVRVKRSGYRLLYVPTARLWHANAASSGSGSSLHDYYLTRNKLIFGMKYAPLRTKFALFRQSLRLFLFGRSWQRRGVIDFYLGRLGKGSFGI